MRLADGTAPTRPSLVVTVSAEQLVGQEGGGGSEALRRAACDSTVEVLFDEPSGGRLRLGRRRRTVSAPLRRALEARDAGCRFPGCDARSWLDAHPLRHWLDGGRTDPENLVLLCAHHHKVVHELGWKLDWDDRGRLRVIDPDGHPLTGQPAPLPRHLADLDNPAIGPETIRSLWVSEPLDLATTVEVLLWRRHRAGRPPFEEAA